MHERQIFAAHPYRLGHLIEQEFLRFLRMEFNRQGVSIVSYGSPEIKNMLSLSRSQQKISDDDLLENATLLSMLLEEIIRSCDGVVGLAVPITATKSQKEPCRDQPPYALTKDVAQTLEVMCAKGLPTSIAVAEQYGGCPCFSHYYVIGSKIERLSLDNGWDTPCSLFETENRSFSSLSMLKTKMRLYIRDRHGFTNEYRPYFLEE